MSTLLDNLSKQQGQSLQVTRGKTPTPAYITESVINIAAMVLEVRKKSTNKICSICSPIGSGKTHTALILQQIFSKTPSTPCVYIAAFDRMSRRDMLEALADALSVSMVGSYGQVLARIKVKVTPEHIFLIDECDGLPVTTLELLRHLSDEAGITLVLLGTPELFLQRILQNPKTDIQRRLLSRLGAKRAEIERINTEDLNQFIFKPQGIHPLTRSESNILILSCSGIWRILQEVAEDARREAWSLAENEGVNLEAKQGLTKIPWVAFKRAMANMQITIKKISETEATPEKLPQAQG